MEHLTIERRTLRLVSDAILIFSAPRTQWAQVLRRLPFSAESDDGIFLEKIVRKGGHSITCGDIAEAQELLLQGRLASR
ncbi:hypothetical protein YC2023_074685 [Brassica napus]